MSPSACAKQQPLFLHKVESIRMKTAASEGWFETKDRLPGDGAASVARNKPSLIRMPT